MLLQPKLNLKVAQRQVLTPGLVQMVSVLALNKLELKEMINSEMVENPVLEEIEDHSASLEEMAGREGDLERSAQEVAAASERKEEKDPFEEIDFGSYFQEYLDPGFRAASNFEDLERPSFENFLSKPNTLSDHLTWQLGSMTLDAELRAAAEVIVGNLDENGYLVALDEEMAETLAQDAEFQNTAVPNTTVQNPTAQNATIFAEHSLKLLQDARTLVNLLDPVGVAARDLRECLLIQLRAHLQEAEIVIVRLRRQQKTALATAANDEHSDSFDDDLDEVVGAQMANPLVLLEARREVLMAAIEIVDCYLPLLQKKDIRELTRVAGRSATAVNRAIELIRTLDPRPGQRYNQQETRLIEPDVAFIKRDDVFVVVMNEEDMPALRLNSSYRRMLRQKETEKDVREYVKERYRSAIQLLRNIEQRKNTIVRTCEVIVRRQHEFLERGVDGLRPMMIKEVAEEIGVHPSTVSRAVANKYVHTMQGVYELRFFFSEGVNGPEGGDLPLPLLKRKVRKLIEEEDPKKPLTDDALTAELQRQGIQVTRRTVAKYREDMNIPSTHQRRKRD